jgi:hypothetical protein
MRMMAGTRMPRARASLGLSSGRLHIKPSAPGIPKPTRDKLRLVPASLGWRSPTGTSGEVALLVSQVLKCQRTAGD